MGVISDILSSIFGNGNEGDTDPKATTVTESDNEIRVRNSDVIIDKTAGTHDTMWSNSFVNTSTGETKFDEGAHGPYFKP